MSVLGDIKNTLGIEPSIKSFDRELMMHANGVFVTLYDLGIGVPTADGLEPMCVTTYSNWDELNCGPELNMVKMYVGYKIKSLWDAPSNVGTRNAVDAVIKEYEYRILKMHERESESHV